jgi:hypothetical protein
MPIAFRKVLDKFKGQTPSEAALRVYLLEQGYTQTAIRKFSDAYFETREFVREATQEYLAAEKIVGGATGATGATGPAYAVGTSEGRSTVQGVSQVITPITGHLEVTEEPDTASITAETSPAPLNAPVSAESTPMDRVERNAQLLRQLQIQHLRDSRY